MDLFQAKVPGQTFHDLLRNWRQNAPVKEITFMEQPAYMLLSYDAVKAAFQDNLHFPPHTVYTFNPEPQVGKTFISMPDPEHALYRQLTMPAFKLKAIANYDTDWVEQLCHELIDRFINNDKADLQTAFSFRLPILVIIRMLGLPREDEEQLHEWGAGILAYQNSHEYAQQCGDALANYLKPIIEERRHNPQNDIITELTQAELQGVTLNDQDIINLVRLLLPTGAETTYLSLGNLLYALLNNNLWQKLQNHPELIDNVIEESFRLEAPVFSLPRMTGDEPFDFYGHKMKPNHLCFFTIGSAHHDETVFENPDQFIPEREMNAPLLTFGPGTKNCPGMHLARKELRIALQALLQRLDNPQLLDNLPPEGPVLRTPPALNIQLH